ncbi:MAG: hypothetical protein U0Q11_15815 [Vicinamibacterales bacterium]
MPVSSVAEVVQRLLADGHHVVCLLRARSNADNLRADAAKPNCRGTLDIVRGHIGRPDTYRDALAGSDVIYHIAAEMKGQLPSSSSPTSSARVRSLPPRSRRR